MKKETQSIILKIFVSIICAFMGVGSFMFSSVFDTEITRQNAMVNLFFACWGSAMCGYIFMSMYDSWVNKELKKK